MVKNIVIIVLSLLLVGVIVLYQIRAHDLEEHIEQIMKREKDLLEAKKLAEDYKVLPTQTQIELP